MLIRSDSSEYTATLPFKLQHVTRLSDQTHDWSSERASRLYYVTTTKPKSSLLYLILPHFVDGDSIHRLHRVMFETCCENHLACWRSIVTHVFRRHESLRCQSDTVGTWLLIFYRVAESLAADYIALTGILDCMYLMRYRRRRMDSTIPHQSHHRQDNLLWELNINSGSSFIRTKKSFFFFLGWGGFLAVSNQERLGVRRFCSPVIYSAINMVLAWIRSFLLDATALHRLEICVEQTRIFVGRNSRLKLWVIIERALYATSLKFVDFSFVRPSTSVGWRNRK